MILYTDSLHNLKSDRVNLVAPASPSFVFSHIHQNLTIGSGSKQRFSLLQEKEVIQAVCLRTQAVSIKARF